MPTTVTVTRPLGHPGGQQDADGGRDESETGLDRGVAALLLQEDRDHEEDALQYEPLDVLGEQAEVRRPVAEEADRDGRRTAAVFAGPGVHEGACQDRHAECDVSPRSCSTRRTWR